jgi:asparagine synthase (glutamine-hydrolysing)
VPIRGFQWLRTDVARHIAYEYAAAAISYPLRWDLALARYWRGRHLQCALASLDALAGDHDVMVASPFVEPSVLSTYASAAGARGPGSRGSALVALFGDLLPENLLRRSTKAGFTGSFWNRSSQSFVDEWAGAGIDERLVCLEGLRAEWRRARPSSNSFALLQRAWLASQHESNDRLVGRQSRDESLGAVLEGAEPAWSS